MERYSMDYGCAFRDERGDWVEALSAIERINELEQQVMALETENVALLVKEDNFHADIEELHNEIVKSEKENAALVEALRECTDIMTNGGRWTIQAQDRMARLIARAESAEGEK